MTFGEKFSTSVKARRRGRPRRPTVKANVRIDESIYDAYCRQALAEHRSVHAVLQRALTTAAPRVPLTR